MKQAECKDCDKRHPGCHSRCESYQAFRKERNEMLDKMHKYKDSIYVKNVTREYLDKGKKG